MKFRIIYYTSKLDTIYSILNKMGKKPNDVPFHMRNVGLRSIHSGSFHMLSALLTTISTLPFQILALTQT